MLLHSRARENMGWPRVECEAHATGTYSALTQVLSTYSALKQALITVALIREITGWPRVYEAHGNLILRGYQPYIKRIITLCQPDIDSILSV